jgi:antimicrobial peptide system SdpA family protein
MKIRQLNSIKLKPLYFYFVWGFWAILIYSFLVTYNPIVIFSHEVKKNFVFTFPQGWGFFTRNPREAMVDVYRQDVQGLELVTVLNSSPGNYFGFSRNSRVVGLEMVEVVKRIPHAAWKNGKGDIHAVALETSDTIKLSKKLKYFVPGTYIFHQYKIVPFAWANLKQEKYKPYLAAKILVSDSLSADKEEIFDLPIAGKK